MRIAMTTLTISPGVAYGDWSVQRRQEKRKRKDYTLTPVNKGGAKLESKRIGTINCKEHDSEGTALPHSTLEVDNSGAQDVVVVKRVQHILRPKGMAGADGGNDLLSERTSLANMLERFLHVLGDEPVHESKGD